MFLICCVMLWCERKEAGPVAIAYTDKDGGPGGIYDGRPSHCLLAISRLERRIHRVTDGLEASLAHS